MKEPLTEELLQDLLSSPCPKVFVDKNRITHRSLSEYLQQLLEEKDLERSKVVREAGINETFGYQILKELEKLRAIKYYSWHLLCIFPFAKLIAFCKLRD